MKLTDAQRHQLSTMIDGLTNYSLNTLSDEQLLDLLGSDFVGYAEVGISETLVALERGCSDKAKNTTWPSEIGNYFDKRKLAENNARNLPSRIKTQQRILKAATVRIAGMEKAQAAQVEDAWKRYRKAFAAAPWWFIPGTEKDGLPPNVWDDANPPYEAFMDGEMSPKRRAQIAALNALLKSTDKEVGQ